MTEEQTFRSEDNRVRTRRSKNRRLHHGIRGLPGVMSSLNPTMLWDKIAPSILLIY